MKCLKCNSEITENYIICPGCGTSVEELKNNNLLKSDEVNTVQNSGLVNPVLESTVVNDAVNNQAFEVTENIDQTNEQVTATMQVQEVQQVQKMEQSSILENVGIKENNFNNELKEKSKAPFVIASILIVIILGVIGVTGYLFVNSPKKMFSTVINTIYGNYSSILKSEAINATSINNEFDVKFNIKTDDEDMGPIMNVISKLSLNGQTQIDYQNKTAAIELNSNYDGKELVNASAYLKDEKIYVLLEDIYDKYITENVEGINEIFEYSNYVDDVKIVMDESVKALNESLKDEYFISERVKMNVDGTSANVNKITLLLNFENTKALAVDILTMLQANEKFVASYANIMKMEKSEIITELQEEINYIKDSSNTSSETIKIIMYTKGFANQFVGFEVVIESDYDNGNFSIINDKKNIYTILFKEKYEDSEEVINGSLEIVDNKYNFTLSVEKIDVNGSVTISDNNKIDAVINYMFEGNEIGLELSYLIKCNEKVTIPNLDDNVNLEDISSDEAYIMLDKLLKNKGAEALVKEVADIMGYDTSDGISAEDLLVVKEPSYDDEYDYTIEDSCYDCINSDYAPLSYQELRKYHGTNKSYEEAYELLTKYYENGASISSMKMNGNVVIDLEIALDMEKASSYLIDPKNDLIETANEYLDRNQTYTINVTLQNDQNTVKISISSEKVINANEYFSNPENR